VKRVEKAAAGGLDNPVILQAFSVAQREIMKCVTAHVLHKNAAARKVSRLSKRVKVAVGEASF
jgi:small subunit ribosomal protein S20